MLFYEKHLLLDSPEIPIYVYIFSTIEIIIFFLLFLRKSIKKTVMKYRKDDPPGQGPVDEERPGK